MVRRLGDHLDLQHLLCLVELVEYAVERAKGLRNSSLGNPGDIGFRNPVTSNGQLPPPA